METPTTFTPGPAQHSRGLTPLGTAVVDWCHRRGITQTELAEAAGLSPSYLSRVLSGKRGMTRGTINALEACLRTGGDLQEAARTQPGSTPAARRTRVVPAQLPPARQPLIGRDRELAALAEAGAGPARGGVTILLDGPTGSGKTALAISHAHRIANVYRDGTLWADLRSHTIGQTSTPVEIAAGFLRALSLPVPDGAGERLRAWRSAAWQRRLLIVLDDVVNAETVAALLPSGAGCATVITSRYRLAGFLPGAGVHTLTVPRLQAAQARRLLAERLGDDRLVADSAATEALVRACDGSPHALHLAAERAAIHPTVPLAELVAETHEDPWELTNLGAGPGLSMYASLAAQYNSLPTEHQQAWRHTAAAGGQITPEDLAQRTGWSVGGARGVLDGLALAHLAARQHTTYRMAAVETTFGAAQHEAGSAAPTTADPATTYSEAMPA